MRTADLELDLDVFAGPFDLLLAVVLREEISLLEVELGEIVLAYLDHLEETGELDLEAATEFLVLIAALLELKSRLMLPAAEEAELDLGPEEAADELLARMLEYRRYKDAGAGAQRALRGRAPVPVPLGAAAARAAPGLARGRAPRLRPRPARRRRSATCCARRRGSTPATSARPSRSSAGSRSCASCSRGAAALDFDEAFGGEDRLTQAVTIFALLELHKKGEATLDASATTSARSRSPAGRPSSRRGRSAA